MFKRHDTEIDGCFVIEGRQFADERGDFFKTFHRSSLADLGISETFPEQYYSRSHRGVVRGMHFQLPPHDQSKIVHCLQGALTDVIVDLRKGENYGRVASVRLQGGDGKLVYVPRGCAHGFIATENDTLMYYMVETEYAPQHDVGILWSSIDFDWPLSECGVEAPIMSARDQAFDGLDAFQSPF